jgi:AcrR family transcriptional regulator
MDIGYDQIELLLAEFNRPPAGEAQERKYRRILDAATELFVHHGYRKTSINDVARRAGIAKGTVYLYFDNKADLLFHAIGEEKARYLTEIKPMFDDSLPASERLRCFIRLTVILSQKMPLVAKLINGDREIQMVMDEAGGAIGEQGSEWEISMVAELIAEAISPEKVTDDELEARAVTLINLLFASITGSQKIGREIEIAQYANLLADMLVHGVARSSKDISI